jgi:hypothetical protein
MTSAALYGGITMADSLLHALLEQSHGFTDDDFMRLDEVTQRLLLSELYDALMKDPQIMPLLVNVILQRNLVPELFDKLVIRIRENYNKISQP